MCNSNGEYLEKRSLTPLYYYIDRLEGQRMANAATVCLLVSEEPIDQNACNIVISVEARGVAIRSPKDQFCKKLGRDIALGRAIQALKFFDGETMNMPPLSPLWAKRREFETGDLTEILGISCITGEVSPHMSERERGIVRNYSRRGVRNESHSN